MKPNQTNNSAQKTIASLIVIIAVVLITVGAKAHEKKSSSATTLNPQQPVQKTASSSSQTQSTVAQTSEFKDGTYSASANYFVPPGPESIKVTLVLKNGMVSDSTLVNSEKDPRSASFQQDFTAEYKSLVVGKSLAGLNLKNVAGATETTQGFDDALQQIRNQAKA